MAGLTVGVVSLPQGIAFALLAGLPAVMGVYASIVAAIVGGLWGSSNQLSTGPTNSSSLLVFSILLPIAVPGSATYIAAAGMLAVRLAPAQRRGVDGVDVVAVVFGGAHHGHRRILPGFQVVQRIDDESQLQRAGATAEQVLLEMQLLGHAGDQSSSTSGAVRSSSMAAARQASRPTTP